MAGKTIVIGCKLPNGIVLFHPMNRDNAVEIQGINKSLIKGATYMTTTVDADFWADWKAAHTDFQPYKSQAIFEAGGLREADDKAKELSSVKTGFEPVKKDDLNVKPADSK
jgi:hypothetical protein